MHYPRVGIQTEKAEVGPNSGPTWRLSHLVKRGERERVVVRLGDVLALDLAILVQVEHREGKLGRLGRGNFFVHCPGRKPPFLAVKRPARPAYKPAIERRCTAGNAKGAKTPRVGPDSTEERR